METVSFSEADWEKLISAQDGSVREISVWFRTKGSSMFPFIHSDTDSILLTPIEPQSAKIGDIVLFPDHRNGAHYCLHRLYKIDGDRVQTFGDGNLRPDGWMPKSKILGKAVLIQRGERQILCDDPKWVRRSRVWTSLWRIRRVLLLPPRISRKVRAGLLKCRRMLTSKK